MQKKMIPKIISFLLLLLLAMQCEGICSDRTALWQDYKTNFITSDGRVIDHAQSQSTHSEGQGYGMSLSLINNDRPAFEKLWDWTKKNLTVRSDNLFAWQWGKRPTGEWGVIDYNNATDGDILIAYALIEASEKWHLDNYKDDALKIIRDIKKNLSIKWRGHSLLLPGYYGFVNEQGIIINPSYFIFPAFRSFSLADDKAFWDKIYSDSLSVTGQSCFGILCLPADWVILKDKASIHTASSAYFGKEAIRLLMYLSSEKSAALPKGIEKVLDFYKKAGYIPLWIDLEKDSFSLQSAPAGYYAIYALAAMKSGDNALSQKLLKEADEKIDKEKKDYYSFSLYLLAVHNDRYQAK